MFASTDTSRTNNHAEPAISKIHARKRDANLYLVIHISRFASRLSTTHRHIALGRRECMRFTHRSIQARVVTDQCVTLMLSLAVQSERRRTGTVLHLPSEGRKQCGAKLNGSGDVRTIRDVCTRACPSENLGHQDWKYHGVNAAVARSYDM